MATRREQRLVAKVATQKQVIQHLRQTVKMQGDALLRIQNSAATTRARAQTTAEERRAQREERLRAQAEALAAFQARRRRRDREEAERAEAAAELRRLRAEAEARMRGEAPPARKRACGATDEPIPAPNRAQ